MKKLLALAVLAAFFSGCFSFTEEITQEPDNTYTISRTVSMGTSMFDMMASFRMMGDSTGIDSASFRREALDSMRKEFGGSIDTFKTFPGYISASIRDTVIDTMFYIITSARVSDAIHLPNFHNGLWASMNKDAQDKDDKLSLVVEKKKNKTYFRYVFPPMEKEQKKQSREEREMAKQFVKEINIYFRFISPNLEPPKGKTKMKKVAGGYEYKVPLLDILDGKKPPKQIEFVIH